MWRTCADLIVPADRQQTWYHELSGLQRIGLSTLEDQDTGCWVWQAATRTPGGYGVFQVGGRIQVAHRFSYRGYLGPIPDGLELDHLCRRLLCVNPEHLEPVTPAENTRRSESPAGINARRTNCHNGHALAGENLIRDGKGRRCRECRNARQRARYLIRAQARTASHGV
jgi:hypothetical protein